MMLNTAVSSRLASNPIRRALLTHSFFKYVKTGSLSRPVVGRFLGQWWHPLHYFPTFLARTIAVVSLAEKSAISTILHQELGEGDPLRAHESIYVTTMRDVGFDREVIMEAPPTPATHRLLRGFEEASRSAASALGYLYATEVADLAMVSGIGEAVRRVTSAERLPWVDIHVRQERDHVKGVNATIGMEIAYDQAGPIERSAQSCWSLWNDFFSTLHESTFTPSAPARASEA